MIKKLEVQNAYESARMHLEGMPHDFLPGFGLGFLVTLHKQLIKSNHMICLGYFEGNKLEGVIFCSLKTSDVLSRVFIEGFWYFIPPIISKLFISPKTLKYLFQTLMYGNRSKDSVLAELLIVAVDKNRRHAGIGSALINQTKKLLNKRNIVDFKVGTLSTNMVANNFYKKNGGKFTHSFSIYDRIWNVYQFSL